MASNNYLLPLYYVRTSKRIVNRFSIERALLVLFIVFTSLTVYILFTHLPAEIRLFDDNENNVRNVFVPKQGQLKERHHEDHVHAGPLDPRKRTQKLHGTKKDREFHFKKTKPRKDDDPENQKRLEKVIEMTKFAYGSYEKYAFGENELRPISKTAHRAGIFGHMGSLGATIVDSLDTLYLMGLHDEFARGRDWVKEHFHFADFDSTVSAFEINIRFIGGFLSAYTLSKDKVFLDKADEVATALLPIFETNTGIPYGLINPKRKSVSNYGWASSCSILSEFGTLSLEFLYLSELTGKPVYAEKIARMQQSIRKLGKGIFYNYVNPNSGAWCCFDASMGGLGDSFYEYLLKTWLYDKRDSALLELFLSTMKAVQEQMVATSPKDKLTYVGELKSQRLDQKMGHLACFSGGLFSMASVAIQNLTKEERERFSTLAAGITNTCHESYVRTETHLGPEAFYFSQPNSEAKAISFNDRYFILRPEVVESYFYLWRNTKEQKYRDWAWDVVESLEKHCKTENGYSGIRDVYQVPTAKDDVQQSFFLAETLKYLYLIFADDSVLPLDEYVFNTEAHPFRVRQQQ